MCPSRFHLPMMECPQFLDQGLCEYGLGNLDARIAKKKRCDRTTVTRAKRKTPSTPRAQRGDGTDRAAVIDSGPATVVSMRFKSRLPHRYKSERTCNHCVRIHWGSSDHCGDTPGFKTQQSLHRHPVFRVNDNVEIEKRILFHPRV